MAIEIEVKFRMERDAWGDIKSAFDKQHRVHHVERQTNQYYNTAGNELEERKIGLRLRVMEDRSVLAIKQDNPNGIHRLEIEETYPAGTETLPPESPALQQLLADIGCTYDQILPLVMLRAERTVYLIEEPTATVEVCFDDVSIVDVCREHKLYEVEFELVSGSEERLLEIVADFETQHGDRVRKSGVSKLAYALNLISCNR